MVTIEKINPANKNDVKRFMQFEFDLYKDEANWVPPIQPDRRNQFNKKKHPFYEHSDADFFIAVKDGKDAGTIGALENKVYNEYQNKKTVNFYFFECINDQEVANALFNAITDWAKERGLNKIVGPKGFGPLDGYGILTEGFEHRQMMTMMNYNFDYYPKLLEALGFGKEVDFMSCYIDGKNALVPERVHKISDRLLNRGHFGIIDFKNKRELKSYAMKIGDAYNKAFVNNWEYYPLSQNELDYVIGDIITIANPKLIRVVTYDETIIGFLFGFQDVSEALKKYEGRLFPFGIFALLHALKKANTVSFNGAGVLPEYHGLGGNALLYSQMDNVRKYFNFEHIEMTQVANTAVQMRNDLENLGGIPYKNHRVFNKSI